MASITKDTIIAEILTTTPEAAPILLEVGMHCLGCARAKTETLGEACASHGVDVEVLLERLNALAE